MDQKTLRSELEKLPKESRTALTARAALRVLPVLTERPKDNTAEVLAQSGFWFWPQKRRQQYLLEILHNQAAAVFLGAGGKLPQTAMRLFFRRRAFASAAIAASSSYSAFAALTSAATAASAATAFAAAAAADAADITFAAAADVTSFATSFAISFAAVAADAVPAADAAAARFYQPHTVHHFQQQLALDLTTLKTQTGAQLLALPLWLGSAPDDWLQSWQILQTHIWQLDPSFAVWLAWYADRIQGVPINLPLLQKWLDLPAEIADSTPSEINAYLAKLANSNQHHTMKQVRTIFLGYGEAGKTSLIRALHGEPIVEGKEAMTPGIDIREWPGAGDGILTHFWDFGGQVIAHATHQFFLRSSCLYVLVLSARAEVNATEQAEYWLQHVKVYGADAPVIIVRNKCDQLPLHLDMASLKSKYPNIIGDFPIACTQAKAGPYQPQFAAFENEFRQQLHALAQRQVLFSTAEFAVLQALQTASKAQAFLPHDQFQTLCEQHGIPQDGVQGRTWLLGLLDRLGVVIHFPQLRQLQEHVINPRWLTYGVYKIMYAGKPRLNLDDIDQLLSATLADERGQGLNYPQAKCQFIALAMECFKLCYPLRHDKTRYIIPGLLETDLPANIASANFDQSQALAYKISFTGFVPRHVMPELIVERNEEIINDLVWQYGALLQHRTLGARAWMQVDYQAREMTIWVSERNAREYLAILRDALLSILSRLTLEKREWIRLPAAALLSSTLHFEQAPDWAVYQQIESYIQRGDQTFISETGREYDLSKLARFYLPTTPAGETMGNATINITGSTITGNVTAADSIQDSFNQTTNSANKPATPNMIAAIGMKTIKIFLASSFELKAERDDFELYLRQQNDHYQEQGIYFKVVRWENFLDAMSATRKQDDYNAAVRDSDIFLSLFATKTGKYTEEEFTVAHDCFKQNGRPYIYTFFKDANVSTANIDKAAMKTLWAFQERLDQLGHFYTTFTSIEDLKLRFSEQLKLLLVPGKLG